MDMCVFLNWSLKMESNDTRERWPYRIGSMIEANAYLRGECLFFCAKWMSRIFPRHKWFKITNVPAKGILRNPRIYIWEGPYILSFDFITFYYVISSEKKRKKFYAALTSLVRMSKLQINLFYYIWALRLV